MKKLLLLLIIGLISLSQVNALQNVQLQWKGDTSDHKTITYGDEIQFVADVTSYNPPITVYLTLQDENGNVKHVYLNEQQYTHPAWGLSSYSGTFTITQEHYNTFGDFKVVLQTHDQEGPYSPPALTLTIVPPTANLVVEASANPTNGEAPLDVDFGCVATGGYPEYTYNWQFGDGYDEDTQMANHVYNYEGTYTATCTVADKYGNTGSDTVTIKVDKTVIPNDAPIADFTINPNPSLVGQEITLDASNSYDPNNDPITYEWDIGNDGDVEFTGKVAYKTFYQAKNYPIKLTVSDGEKSSSVVKYAIVQAYEGFDVNLKATPTSGDAPLDVEFVCEVESTNNGLPATYKYTFDFGDGIKINSNSQRISHIYEVGSYKASCTVEQIETGNTDYDSVIIEVYEPTYEDFSVELTANPYFGTVPLNVDFTCDLRTVGNGLEGDYLFTYNFGDGIIKTSYSETTSHTYTNHGVYTPKCSVEQIQTGIVKSDSTTVYVNEPTYEGFDVNMYVEPTSGYAPLEVSGYCEAEPKGDGMKGSYSYVWIMHDGTKYYTANITHTYTEVGEYNPECYVTQKETGSWAKRTAKVTVLEEVKNNPPVADLEIRPNPAQIGDVVTFDASGSYDSDGDSLTYYWDVQDTFLGYGPEAIELAFYDAGEYKVKVRVGDGEDESYATGVLVVEGPIDYEDFNIFNTLYPRSGTAPHKVYSACSPITIPFTGEDASYEVVMDFGDGTVIVDDRFTTHIYTEPGTYEYTCTIEQLETGLKKSVVKDIVVTEEEDENLPPVAMISGPSNIKQLEEAVYDASNSYDPEGADLTYVWYVEGKKVQQGSSDTLKLTRVALNTFEVKVVVYDDKGLSDEANTFTSVTKSSSDDDKTPAADHEFTFVGIGIMGHDVNRVRAGETLYVNVGTISDDTEGRPSLIVPELGLKATGQLNDLEGRESMTISLWIPPNTPPGDYMLRVGFKSEEVRKGEIRWFTVE